MLHEMCGSNLPDTYDEVTQKVIAELRKQFLPKGVSLEVLSKLENLWREKLKATECFSKPNQIKNIEQLLGNNKPEEIETPGSSFLNGLYILTGPSNDKLNNTILEPLITSDRLLTVKELEEALQKKRQLRSNKSSHVEQSDGCNDTSDDEDETDDFNEVTNISDQSDDDNIGNIKLDNHHDGDFKLDDDEIVKMNKIVHELIDSVNVKECNDIKQGGDDTDEDTCGDEEINSDDELPGFDPHWDECKNTVYCTSSNIKLSKQNNMKFRLNLENGIMHIEGKDYVFKKLSGSSFWR